jgi:transcriptional regulator with XRE-family HTH domain
VVKPSTTFAGRLRSLREAAGLSQYALAKRSGLSKQALSRLELGENEPIWTTVQRLAVALAVDCREFVDPSIQPEPEPPSRPRGRPRKAAAAATEGTAGTGQGEGQGARPRRGKAPPGAAGGQAEAKGKGRKRRSEE